MRRVVLGALALAVAACLATALATLVFSEPVDDDFAFAVRGAASGPFEFAAHQYLHWSGRWLSFAFLGGLLGALDPVRHDTALLLGAWIAFASGLYLALRGTLALRRGPAAVGAVALFALVLAALGTEEVAETFFWISGAITYLVALGAALGAVGLAQVHRSGAAAGACVLAVAASGLHEVVGGLCVLALGALALHERRVRAPLAAAVIGLIVVVVAPGNGERARATLAAERDAAAQLAPAFERLALHLPDWAFDPLLIGAVLVAFAQAARGGATARPTAPARSRSPWTGVAWWLAASVAALLAPAVLTGGWVPHRLLAVGHVVFVLGAVAIAARAGASSSRPVNGGILAVGLALVLVGLAMPGPLRAGVADLEDGRPQRWSAARADWYAAARTGGDVVLDPPPSRPRLLPRSTMASNADHWANARFAEFFGARSVRVERGTSKD
ncbi:DUF6056 family protein [Planctomycetes bacterium Pla163]|uniref:DUF6056 family protein n=1 Tax=Rohdeia mirabilis TaxID=2528008 RepID=UPI0011A983E2